MAPIAPPGATPEEKRVDVTDLAWDSWADPAWVVLAILCLTFLFLFLEKGTPDQVMLGALVLTWNLGIIDTNEALMGFGNPGLITIGALFVVVQAVDRSRVVDRAARRLLGRGSGEHAARLRLCSVGFLLSGFLNNTPLVALLMPIVRDWARARGFAASKFLLPLSYSTIMGGLVTLIGTSTNLLVTGLMEQEGIAPFGFFDPGYVSLPVGCVGLVYLLVIGPRLLPENRGGLFRALREKGDEMVTAVEFLPEFDLLGKGVYAVLDDLGVPHEGLLKIVRPVPPEISASFRLGRQTSPGTASLSSLTARAALEEEEEDDDCTEDSNDNKETTLGILNGDVDGHCATTTSIFPVPNHEVVSANDVLLITAGREALVGMLSKHRKGIRIRDTAGFQMLGDSSEFVELVLGPQSRVVGERVASSVSFFEREYKASPIAVRPAGQHGTVSMEEWREGLRSMEDRSDEWFAVGDTVLVLAPVGTEFSRRDFLLVTKVADLPAPPKLYDYLPLPMFLVGLVLVAFGVFPMVRVALTLSVVFVLGGWVKSWEIERVVDWHLLTLIGSALGISRAVTNSGLSSMAAAAVMRAGLPPRGAMALLFFVTMVTTELITNNAAAALGFPLALDLTRELGLSSERPLVMIVMLAASTSYASPIGYATNLMVFGPGGYRFADFARIGIGMDLIYLLGSVAIVPLIWPLV
eukprot:TRINITY_DN55537_c0_g1_i1.p1 TRINITY_DN55537_c0_g1~~TRINITY_DN55537_c0_g1_i1.p1  ORF type:complete len:695 (+),score=169.61 TRINITY_DN55537_c0_g1_i1:157-2241(+)